MTTVLSTNRVDSRSLSSRGCAFRLTHTNTDPIRLLCVRLPLPSILSLPSQFAPSSKLMVDVSPRALWLAGAFLRDCTFWDYRGGGLTRQPMGPPLNTAAITTATSINHVNSGSLSSRCCNFRRTHKSIDPIRIPGTLYPTSFTLDSLLALTIRVQRKTYGWWYTLCPMACMFSGKRGGELTINRQLVRPPVGTATMTAVTSANCVDLESFSSGCCTFRRTHTSADPIRVLCTRLAFSLTFYLPSRLAPSARRTVGVPPRALWLVGIFLHRKKICAGVRFLKGKLITDHGLFSSYEDQQGAANMQDS